MKNRAAEDYLKKKDSSSCEELLLQFVISQCANTEMYLSAAATLTVSFVLHQIAQV